MADDQQLWGKLKSGDRKAFDQIYRTYSTALYRYGYKFSKDTTLLEDCIHDLFIYLWKHREGLSDTTAITPYLFTSFRDRIIKSLKKRQKTKLGEKEEMKNHFDLELSKAQSIVQEESIIENKQMLNETFTQLSPREKEAVYLKYNNQFTSAEICKIMNISNQSFSNVLAAAIEKMNGKILK